MYILQTLREDLETRLEEPAADARKAEGASCTALQMPSPPIFTGSEAWVHAEPESPKWDNGYPTGGGLQEVNMLSSWSTILFNVALHAFLPCLASFQTLSGSAVSTHCI